MSESAGILCLTEGVADATIRAIRMRRRFMRWAVLAVPLANCAAAIAIGLSRINWPSAAFWSGRQGTIIGAIAVAAVAPLVQTAFSELGEKRRRKELEREAHIRTLLVPSLIVAVRDCKAPWESTGIQAFLVTGWLWRKRHVRVAKLRMASIPSSGVSWKQGKGVIGLCWQTRTAQWEQLDGAFAKLGDVGPDRWLSLDTRRTYGLSFTEYQALGTKYGTVAAVPIIDSGDKYIGCVTLDTPAGVKLEHKARGLESLAVTADLVGRHVKA